MNQILFVFSIFADDDVLEKPHALKEGWEHQGDSEGQPGLYPSTFYLQIWLVCACVCERERECVHTWGCDCAPPEIFV